MKWKFKVLDFAAFFLALSVLVSFSLYAYQEREGEPLVHIKGAEEWYYPLDEVRSLSVSGPLGTTEVEIREGHAAVVSSDCPGQICVHQGEIHRPGELIACLPNQVLIVIEAEEGSGELDGFSY